MTLELLLLCAPMPAAQELPDGKPHPSQVVSSHMVSREEQWDHDGWLDPDRLWVRLAPGWVSEEETELLPGEELAALADFVAARNGWGAGNRDAWASAMKPSSLQFEYSFKDEASGEMLFGGSESIQTCQPKRFADLQARSVVRDFDVEIAQSANIADPVGGVQFGGSSLAVQVLPLPGIGYQAEIALVGTSFGEDDAIDTHYHAIQGADRLAQSVSEFGTTAVLVPGQPATIHVPRHDGVSGVLTIKLDGPMPEPGFRAGSTIHCSAVPSLAASEDWPEIVAGLELIGDTWSSSGGYLAFAGESAEEQAAMIAQQVVRSAQSHQVSMDIALETAQGDRQILTLHAPTVVGNALHFADGALSQALTDWDVEVAQTARIADPLFETFFDGVEGSLVVGEDGTVDLDLDFRRVTHGNPAMLTLSGGQTLARDNGGNVLAMPADTLAVERPEVAHMGVAGRFTPDADGVIRIERHTRHLFAGSASLIVTIRTSAAD